ncbi:MAG: hypothetical protein ABL958_06470 [Bdellovibrionia bacterium]
MGPKDFAIFIYGLFMGTSTGYLKAKRSHFFPNKWEAIDDSFGVLTGGTCNCGVLRANGEIVLINTSRDLAAVELRRRIEGDLGASRSRILVATSSDSEDVGGVDYFRNFVREKSDFEAAGEKIRIQNLGDNDLVYLTGRKALFTGRFFYNAIHPPLREHGRDLKKWIAALDEIQASFDARLVIPAEGEVSDLSGVRSFRNYLQDFTDPAVTLETLREKYSEWGEIIGLTALAENYEYARGIVVK